MIGLRQNPNPNSPIRRGRTILTSPTTHSNEKDQVQPNGTMKSLGGDLSLPKLGDTSAAAAGRPPAPALLVEEQQVQKGNQPPEDPLGHPASFATLHNKPLHHHLHNPPSSMIQMTDSQLRAALDRWDKNDSTNETGDHGDASQAQQQEQEGGFFSSNFKSMIARLDPKLGSALDQWDTTTTTAPQEPQPQQHPSRPIPGAVACLCSATLGAGILSLPYAMAEAGMVCGMILLVGSALATALSIQLLVQAMQVVYYNTNHNRPHDHEETTYEELVQRVLNQQWRRVAEACMLIFCGGAAVAYVIAVGDIVQQSQLVTQKRAVAQTVAWACAMVPLSMLKTMKSLECASSIGIASIVTLVVAAFYHYWQSHTDTSTTTTTSTILWEDEEEEEEESQSIWVPTNGLLSILRACPIILFAFSCQVNVCAIYDEMPGQLLPTPETTTQSAEVQQDDDNNNPEGEDNGTTNNDDNKYRRMTLVTWWAVSICAVLYSSISIIALLDFGSTDMKPNILSSYNPESVMLVAFVGMTLAVTLAYPMNIFPARVTLLGIVRSIQQQRRRQQAPVETSDLEQPLLPSTTPRTTLSTAPIEPPQPPELSEVEEESTAAAQQPVGNGLQTTTTTTTLLVEHVVATLFLTGASLGLALVAPNISVVFGLLGGTSSSVLGFVIPGMLGYATAKDFYKEESGAAQRTQLLSAILVVVGVVVGLVTTAVTVYLTFASSS